MLVGEDKAFYLTGVNHLSTIPIPNSFNLVLYHLFKRPGGDGLAQSRYSKLIEKYHLSNSKGC